MPVSWQGVSPGSSIVSGHRRPTFCRKTKKKIKSLARLDVPIQKRNQTAESRGGRGSQEKDHLYGTTATQRLSAHRRNPSVERAVFMVSHFLSRMIVHAVNLKIGCPGSLRSPLGGINCLVYSQPCKFFYWRLVIVYGFGCQKRKPSFDWVR